MKTKIVILLLILSGTILGGHLTTNALDLQKKVTGIVTDIAGNPLNLVEVLVKGRSIGTATNSKGTYTLIVTSSDTLVFSKKEMKTKEVPVGEKTQIDVVLEKAKK